MSVLPDHSTVADDVLRYLLSHGRAAIFESRTRDGYRLRGPGAAIDLGPVECRVASNGVTLSITDERTVQRLHDRLADWLAGERTPSPPEVPGVLRAETLTNAAFDELCARALKPHYTHDEVFGSYCFVATHIESPYDDVFEYCADPLTLAEWTLNIRKLVPAGEGLFRGKMVFSPEDAAAPATDIFIRADALKGAEFGTICYPCAWDDREPLWMRYYFVFADAAHTLGRPGTVVLWVNCKHPYYDRATADVPPGIARGRARTDRPWAGDAWSLFSPLHQTELANLKTILEERCPCKKTR